MRPRPSVIESAAKSEQRSKLASHCDARCGRGAPVPLDEGDIRCEHESHGAEFFGEHCRGEILIDDRFDAA
jgi:hypothetical protein